MTKSKVKEETSKTEPEVKLPPLSFGKRVSIFSGGKSGNISKFTPKTFRVTQHKGG